MSEKEIYEQKIKAKLEEWRSEIDKMRAKASGASADAKLEINKKADELEAKIKEGKNKLAELVDASDDQWQSMKDDLDSKWESLKSAFSDAALKFKS